ncbi:MAG TPA: hypothetical protein V6D07_18570 [Trichocoleus sp.]
MAEDSKSFDPKALIQYGFNAMFHSYATPEELSDFLSGLNDPQAPVIALIATNTAIRILDAAGHLKKDDEIGQPLKVAPYWWVVTKVDDKEDMPHIGLIGPRNAQVGQREDRAFWEVFDDDNNRMASGYIFGNYSGFEPLDDWARGEFGCTSIKINGKML